MKFTIIFLLFFSLSHSQEKVLLLKIQSITAIDSINQRIFCINYSIENLSTKEISFFLNPLHFTPNKRASLSKSINFKIFEDEKLLDVDNIFINKSMLKLELDLKNAKSKEEKDIILKNYFKLNLKMNFDSVVKKDINELNKEKEKLLFKSILTLNPLEKKVFLKELIWDKTRYFKFDEEEYFINNESKYSFEISIDLLSDYFLKTSNDIDLIKNYNFINGTFVSNKIEISFKE